MDEFIEIRPKSIRLFVKSVIGECYEICRVRLQKAGDAYFIPLPSYRLDLHESFHSSGELHWRFEGAKLPPFAGPLSISMPLWLRTVTLDPVCACITCDRLRLNIDQIALGLRLILRVFPYGLSIDEIDEIAKILKRNGIVIFRITKYEKLPLKEFLMHKQKKRIDYIRKLMEGTKFEGTVITFEEALKKKSKSGEVRLIPRYIVSLR